MNNFNKTYNIILQKINRVDVDNALNKLEIMNSKYYSMLEKQLQDIIKQINNTKFNTATSQNYKIIQLALHEKGAYQLAKQGICNLVNIYAKNGVPQLAQDINSIDINQLSTGRIKEYSNEKVTPIVQRIFNYKKLNKTTSMANIGRGQLFLALLIKDAKLSGIDDLVINGKNYNVKEITNERKNNNSMISLFQEKYEELCSKLVIDNKIYTNFEKFKQKASEKAFLEFLYTLKEALIFSTKTVEGYILIEYNSYPGQGNEDIINNIKFKLIKNTDILLDPLKYLYGITAVKSNRNGIYFKGSTLDN